VLLLATLAVLMGGFGRGRGPDDYPAWLKESIANAEKKAKAKAKAKASVRESPKAK
jgi:hypothetical protein